MTVKPFESVRNQIGFCGIYCGSCTGGNNAIQELTRKYEQTIKNSQPALKQWAPKEFNYNELTKNLTCIQAMPLCPGCRKGGGPPDCKIRICALQKGLEDCSRCEQLIACKNFEKIEKGNPKIKEELLKIKNANREKIIEKWIEELRGKWPHCVLFCNV